MHTNPLIPVILAGGAGTRLWPLSRQSHPKPFMELPDGECLLQKTLQRVAALPEVALVLTVTNREYYFQTRDVYEATPVGQQIVHQFLLEPIGRNTAPAIAAAALQAQSLAGPDACLLVLPADHLVTDLDAFQEAVGQARMLAAQGMLVTFGIQPTRPETGFGYIEAGEPLAGDHGRLLGQRVQRFVEKPDRAMAESFLQAGNYYWNSGMFCFQVDHLLEAFRTHAPEILAGAEECMEAIRQDGSMAELPTRFATLPDISIDYALMEKSNQVAVVPAGFDWSDIGSWSAYAELCPADSHGNRVQGDTVLIDAHHSVVVSRERLTTLLGVDHLIVIDTPDALLVAAKDRDQEVKAIVAELKRRGHETHLLHRTVHRPWGTYTVLEEGPRFKIKRIMVKPGAALSLQMHHHRSEHWIVVSGTAKIVNGDAEHLIRTNESTYIPAGTPHRLLNPGVIDLVMIEVQSGEYLGEDDIVRFDDRYGRHAVQN